MWSFAWPWVLAALPLAPLVYVLFKPSRRVVEAGLKVPSLSGFQVLVDRSKLEQFVNWRFWLMLAAWVLLVISAARPERIGDEIETPVTGRNLMLAVDLSGSMNQRDFVLGDREVDRLTATKGGCQRFHRSSRRGSDRTHFVWLARLFTGSADTRSRDGLRLYCSNPRSVWRARKRRLAMPLRWR